jgi:hypothetical protein
MPGGGSVSYYIGVWEGPAPLSNAHAGSEFQRLLADRGQAPASPTIRRFVDALLEAHADIDRPEGEDSPWSDGPLIHCVDGAVAYLPVRPERVDDVTTLIEERAAGLDLVAFDPQRGELLPSATSVTRTAEFELPPPEEVPIHLRALLGEAMAAETPLAGVLEQATTDFYVQWLVRNGSLTIEAQGDELLPEQLRLSPAGRAQMSDLGFTEAEPNWQIRWPDGHEHLDEAAVLLARVIGEVRRIPVGEVMRLETFPV